MSVVVQNKDSKQIEVLTKGADSFVEEKLSSHEKKHWDLVKCKEHILRFAKQGLRTLMLAKKTVEKKDYDEWNTRV